MSFPRYSASWSAAAMELALLAAEGAERPVAEGPWGYVFSGWTGRVDEVSEEAVSEVHGVGLVGEILLSFSGFH